MIKILNFLTKEKCSQLRKKHRWEYLKIAVKYVKLINPDNCLELGAATIPIVSNGDTMDKNEWDNLTYFWNALKIPWPVEDKKYNVFVALQVWEHLKNKQNEVFQEVARISDWAVLSLPYKWDQEGSHGRITKSVILNWTSPYKPFIKPCIVRKRIIYVFKFSKKSKEDKQIRKLMEDI